MFESKNKLFLQLHEMSPAWLVKLIIHHRGLTVSEVNEFLYNPALLPEGEKNDFEKMMEYEPMSEDCAEKLYMLFGAEFTKENMLMLDKQWKELLEKKGLPKEAYEDFFQFCYGYKVEKS